MRQCFRHLLAAGAESQSRILDRRMKKSSLTQQSLIMHDLYPRDLAVWTNTTEVATKGIEVNFLPDLIRPPLLVALQVST